MSLMQKDSCFSIDIFVLMKRILDSMKKQGYSPTKAILESISDGVFTIDLSWRITSFNRAAEEITGVSRNEAIGSPCSDVFKSSMCASGCPLLETLQSGKPIIGKTGYIITSEGVKKPISISTAVLRNEYGEIIGGAETFRDLSEIWLLKETLEKRSHAGKMTSKSPLMQNIFEILPAVSESPSTVLITGETGTGKEVLARTIHEHSLVSSGPFIAVNCSALPDTLLESELFGYKAGAFTGAVKDKPGRFARAKGGTLFLDEIGDISPALQVRLLRVLQDKEYEPLGSSFHEKADVRVITATNRDLQALVREKSFREDLYYRINVVRIDMPPLRKRKEDIPLLAEEFIDRFNVLQGKQVSAVSPEALSMMMAYDWPGNIRELENVIERAFLLCSTGEITIGQLPEEIASTGHIPAADIRSAHDLLDAQAIMGALERCGYNRLAAAQELGIHKATLFRKIQKLGLTIPKSRK